VPIKVWDFHKDNANVVVFPEIRARFSRMEPGPAGLLHSHDIAGEVFVVLDGQCEFIVEDERVTCGPGQMIYVEPKLRHTLHAVGDASCTVYLSVTPHVEPTHTRWNAALEEQPPRYGTWRGKAPDPHAGTNTADLARAYAAEARTLADVAAAHAAAMDGHAKTLGQAGDSAECAEATKDAMDDAWRSLRDVLWQMRTAELAWNALSPRAVPPNATK
jgi:mannose-6-phosphate isomerase-like protein (cupin superfamily)